MVISNVTNEIQNNINSVHSPSGKKNNFIKRTEELIQPEIYVSISDEGITACRNHMFTKQLSGQKEIQEFQEISIDPSGEYYLDMQETTSQLMKEYKENHTTYGIEETADMALQSYSKLYNEIKNGYADGSRKKWIGTNDGGKRKLTEAEDLEFLNRAYDRVIEGQMAFAYCQEVNAVASVKYGDGNPINIPRGYQDTIKTNMKEAQDQFHQKYDTLKTDNMQTVTKNIISNIFNQDSVFANSMKILFANIKPL